MQGWAGGDAVTRVGHDLSLGGPARFVPRTTVDIRVAELDRGGYAVAMPRPVQEMSYIHDIVIRL